MKNFRFVLALTVCAGLLTASSASAQLIVNGTFDTPFAGPVGGNHLQFDALDAVTAGTTGWTTKNPTIGFEHVTDHAENKGVGALAQVNKVTTETGNSYELSFEWTPATALEPIEVLVVGHKFGTTPAATDRFFTGLNFASNQSRAIGAGGSWTDLNDGSSHTGNANADPFTFTGGTATFTLNFGEDNIEDFDTIGVKFKGPLTPDGVLDNVALTAVTGGPLLGDVDMSGEVNFLDIGPFIDVLSGGTFQAEADCDESGEVNFLDIGPFIDILSGP